MSQETALIDIDLTDDEALLAKTVRSYFADFVDNTYLNRQVESQEGYEATRWRQMVDLGWTAVNLPTRVGGAGGTLAEAGLVAREHGRAAFASPMLQTMRAGTALDTLRRDERHDPVLSRIAAGGRAALIAPPDRTVVAEPADDGGYRLRGEPTMVEWLEHADDAVLLLPVADGERWLCAVLSPQRLSARSVAVPSIDNERVFRLDLDGLVVPLEAVSDDELTPRLAQYALARADLLRASAMVGGCEAVLEMSARYANERVQFGQQIGAFQAVRHHLARMVIAADAARLTCNEALTRAEPEADEYATALVAAFVASRSYAEMVLTAAQIHGGVGTTTEHILHHHFVRAKAMQLRAGKRINRLREIHRVLVVAGEGSLW